MAKRLGIVETCRAAFIDTDSSTLGAPAVGPYGAQMDLHGTIEANLVSAIASAKRLRGHPVHQDTISHWSELLHQAKRELAANEGDNREVVLQLVAELETELAGRGTS